MGEALKIDEEKLLEVIRETIENFVLFENVSNE